MTKLLLNIDFLDSTKKWWHDSIKNEIVPLKGSVHETVARALEEHGIKMSYKGKPQGNIFVDTKDGTKRVGYLYRVKIEMQDENYKWHIVPFEAWVSIKEVRDFPIDNIDGIE